MVRDGIKFKNKDVYAMCILMDHVDAMMECLEHWVPRLAGDTPGDAGQWDVAETTRFRLECGLLLRSTKELWVTCLLLATTLKLGSEQGEQVQHITRVDWTRASMSLYWHMLRLDLDHCWTRKPLLDGKSMMAALGLSKGPEIGAYVEEQVRWMLMNPNGTKADIVAHLLSFKQLREVQSAGDRDIMNDPSLTKQALCSEHLAKRMHVE